MVVFKVLKAAGKVYKVYRVAKTVYDVARIFVQKQTKAIGRFSLTGSFIIK